MDLIKIIDEAIENAPEDPKRYYIGASGIGNDCARAIWYSYKGQDGKAFTARQKRIFKTGHTLEEMVKDYIEQAGFKLIRDKDEIKKLPADEHPLFCQDEEIPIFQGHCDGLLYVTDKTAVVLEIKTAKESEYKKFAKDGLKAWKSSYYAQCHSYMGMKKLKHCLMIVICKNTSDWSCEWLEYDDIFYHEMKAKALMISKATQAPPKINKNPSWWACQFCKFKDVCHKPEN